MLASVSRTEWLLALLATFSLLLLSSGFQTPSWSCRRGKFHGNLAMNLHPKLLQLDTRWMKSLGVALLFASPLITPSLPSLANPAYLTEPTADFKAEEEKVRLFNQNQAKIRKGWDEIVSKFESSTNAAQTEAALSDMLTYIQKIEDMPTGVKKRELVKTCRAKKFNGKKVRPEWTTNVEIVYEKLIQEVNRRLAPGNAAESRL